MTPRRIRALLLDGCTLMARTPRESTAWSDNPEWDREREEWRSDAQEAIEDLDEEMRAAGDGAWADSVPGCHRCLSVHCTADHWAQRVDLGSWMGVAADEADARVKAAEAQAECDARLRAALTNKCSTCLDVIVGGSCGCPEIP